VTVVVDSATSQASPVLSGVPQGSVLGPLLFLIYINCVCLVPLSEGSMISMYADDILLCKPIHHPENYDVQGQACSLAVLDSTPTSLMQFRAAFQFITIPPQILTKSSAI